MPTAIELTSKNIDLIAETLGIDKKEVSDNWYDKVMGTDISDPANPVYYVKDSFYRSIRMPYLIYTEREFLDDFATVPPGIETRFVPVTRIKVEP